MFAFGHDVLQSWLSMFGVALVVATFSFSSFQIKIVLRCLDFIHWLFVDRSNAWVLGGVLGRRQ